MANAYLGAIGTVAESATSGFEAVFIVGDEAHTEHDLSKAERLIGWRPQSHKLI